MNVSFAVQAHPDRALQASALAGELGADVVYDPDQENPIRSPWRTFRYLLELTPAWATHRAQFQDDAWVCPHAREAIEAAVEARPDRLLVFFVGQEPRLHSIAVMRSCHLGLPWAELDYAQWVPVVATCWPAWMIPQLLEYVDAQKWSERFTSDDEIVGRFVREIRHVPLATVPSLVEHPETTPSLIGRRTGRHAACWIGDCESCDDARTIDWTLGV